MNLLKPALLVAAGAVVVFLIWSTFGKFGKNKKTAQVTGNETVSEKSLYERLGGIYAIAAVVNHFSDALISNPITGVNSENPQLREWSRNKLDRLPGLKWLRTLWVAEIAGGPYRFVPSSITTTNDAHGKNNLNLQKPHCPFQISPKIFDEVAKELARTLDVFKVPAKEKSEVLAAFAAHKGEVVSCF